MKSTWALAVLMAGTSGHLAGQPLELATSDPASLGLLAASEPEQAAERSALVDEVIRAHREEALARGYDLDAWQAELGRVLLKRSRGELISARDAASYDEMLTQFGLASPPTDALGDLARDLVFVPVPPCRILDSTVASAPFSGPLPHDVDVSYSHTSNLALQGGNAAGCGVPEDAAAISVTFKVLSPAGGGSLMVREFGAAATAWRVLYYTSGSSLPSAATATLKVCPLCGSDFSLRPVGSDTHVQADVLGYFRAPAPTPLACTDQSQTTIIDDSVRVFSISSRTCPAGSTVTGGGFDLTVFEPATPGLMVDRSSPRFVGTASRWECTGRNETGRVVRVACNAVCCKVPGR